MNCELNQIIEGKMKIGSDSYFKESNLIGNKNFQILIKHQKSQQCWIKQNSDGIGKLILRTFFVINNILKIDDRCKCCKFYNWNNYGSS